MKKLQFWNWHFGANKVLQKFDDGLMTPKEKFRYLLIAVVFLSVVIELLGWSATEFSVSYSAIDKVNSLVYIVATALGALYLYRKHTEATSFVEKYIVAIVTTFPVVLFVIAIPTTIILSILASVVFDEVFLETATWFDVLVTIVLSMLTYWKIGTYFK